MKRFLPAIIISIFFSLFTALFSYASYCGDGELNPEAGEECDDGNYDGRDGCDSYCRFEDLDPPTVSSVSIPNESTDIPTTTNQITIHFSEPILSKDVNDYNIYFEHEAKLLNFDTSLDNSGTIVTIDINEDLLGESRYAVHVINVEDLNDNQMPEEFISVFDTGEYIDLIPPTVVLYPPKGQYQYTQTVTMSAYIDDHTSSDENLDIGAKIYYTLDGTTPTTESTFYEEAISISEQITIRYFAVDEADNKSSVTTDTYTFDCNENEKAESLEPYPSCRIIECSHGYVLKGNVCVIRLGGTDEDDLDMNAVTAPYFSSSTPMTITTKPAIRITKDHEGIIRRPIKFVDPLTGNILLFERNTTIKDGNMNFFTGYIKPPTKLYSKNFPINFGYTFKSILSFDSVDDTDLNFAPPYKMTIPFTDAFDPDEPACVFTYDPSTEIYTEHSDYSIDLSNQEVTIRSKTTGIFFIAQKGKSYNKAEFRDMNSHWARNYAEALYRRGVVKGRSKGIYAPNDILTRAEFTKIALESIGAEVEDADSVENSPFADVHLYAWYVAYVKKAKDIGLINGYPDGTFKPDQPINRAEAIKILINAFKFDLSDYSDPSNESRAYNDLLGEQWYFPATHFVIKNNLLDGLRNDDNTGFFPDWFGPDRSISRGEMAKLAIQTLELFESSE